MRRRLWLSPTEDVTGGGTSGGEGDNTTPPNDSQPNTSGTGEYKFPDEAQPHVNRITGEARKEGRRAGSEAVIKDLQFATLDEAKTFVANARKAEEAHKKALDDLQSKLDGAEETHNSSLKQAKVTVVKLAIKDAAREKGLNPDKLVELVEATGGFDRFEVDLKTGTVKGLDKVVESATGLAPRQKAGVKLFGQGTPDNTGDGNGSGGEKAAANSVLSAYKRKDK